MLKRVEPGYAISAIMHVLFLAGIVIYGFIPSAGGSEGIGIPIEFISEDQLAIVPKGEETAETIQESPPISNTGNSVSPDKPSEPSETLPVPEVPPIPQPVVEQEKTPEPKIELPPERETPPPIIPPQPEHPEEPEAEALPQQAPLPPTRPKRPAATPVPTPKPQASKPPSQGHNPDKLEDLENNVDHLLTSSSSHSGAPSVENGPQSPSRGASDGGSVRSGRGGRGWNRKVFEEYIERELKRPACRAPNRGQSTREFKFEIYLSEDGNLKQTPQPLDTATNTTEQLIINDSIQAIINCAPFRIPARFLPHYEHWERVTVTFEVHS